MTKGEAKRFLGERLALIEREQYPVDDYADALRVAIKTLDEDNISRKKALKYVDDVPFIKDHPHIGDLWKVWIESL